MIALNIINVIATDVTFVKFLLDFFKICWKIALNYCLILYCSQGKAIKNHYLEFLQIILVLQTPLTLCYLLKWNLVLWNNFMWFGYLNWDGISLVNALHMDILNIADWSSIINEHIFKLHTLCSSIIRAIFNYHHKSNIPCQCSERS